jgi:hypothetical protein
MLKEKSVLGRTQMSDAGTYSLVAENRNGQDSVDLDLIVLDEVHANDCDMFLNGSLECTCNNRFRAECSDQEHIKLGIQVRWVRGRPPPPLLLREGRQVEII